MAETLQQTRQNYCELSAVHQKKEPNERDSKRALKMRAPETSSRDYNQASEMRPSPKLPFLRRRIFCELLLSEYYPGFLLSLETSKSPRDFRSVIEGSWFK